MPVKRYLVSMEIEYGVHFIDMMRERNRSSEWVDCCICNSDRIEDYPDGTRHFLKRIEEFGNRWLRVIVNKDTHPCRGVTVFFDRRLRGII
jgi:hypothetical protein